MPDPQAKPSQGAEREQQVQTIFSEIAPRYDLLNHVLSANIDRAWRRKAIDLLGWESHRDGVFLDACAGTYDLSLELAKRPDFTGTVVASDFAQPMLVVGQPKLEGADVAPVCGDSLRLPFHVHSPIAWTTAATASSTVSTRVMRSKSLGRTARCAR